MFRRLITGTNKNYPTVSKYGYNESRRAKKNNDICKNPTFDPNTSYCFDTTAMFLRVGIFQFIEKESISRT